MTGLGKLLSEAPLHEIPDSCAALLAAGPGGRELAAKALESRAHPKHAAIRKLPSLRLIEEPAQRKERFDELRDAALATLTLLASPPDLQDMPGVSEVGASSDELRWSAQRALDKALEVRRLESSVALKGRTLVGLLRDLQ